MTRSLSNSVGILLGIMILCSIPAHAQIVSYVDSNGIRVYINANPAPVVRRTRTSLLKGLSSTRSASLKTQVQPATGPAVPVATQATREKIEQMIRQVSARYRVDPALVRAVIQTESNWNSKAVSSKGALGLMQLVPGTAQQLGVHNAFDPRQNIDGGVRYLHTLLERYNGDLDMALAAYNAGPGAVDRAGGIPQYRETRNYVQKVTDSYYRPGSDRLPRAFDAPHAIYRTVDSDGRVVF
ncbi:MAG TPA: lytic transglycosylase domain-containing protein, partial [Candidatus Dormibacteraeota bacterium]|nr:lytic transglycosylase domain-containing protein [Candidatus Dormibacteraeota bacterium]